MKTCVIYCRVSSKEQVEGTSLQMQERLCSDFAVKLGMNVEKIFIEEGESAKSANRPAFQKAIRYAVDHCKTVGAVIVYKLDRFARNMEDYVQFKVLLKKYDIKLLSATEQLTDDPVGKFCEGMLALVAEFDNDIRSVRSKSGMIERVKQGVWVWNSPVGYYRSFQGDNIQPDPKSEKIIAKGFDDYAAGKHTFASLADWFNIEGLQTTLGKKLLPQTVQKMIRNPLYCGRIEAFGLNVKGNFAMVSEEIFDRCQAVADRFSKADEVRVPKNPNFPLRGLVSCEMCGQRLTGSFSTGKSGKKFGFYHHGSKKCEVSSSVGKDKLEEMFRTLIAEIQPNAEYSERFKRAVVRVWKEKYKVLGRETKDLHGRLERLMASRQKAFDHHLNGKYSDAEFEEQKLRLDAQAQEVRAEIAGTQLQEYNIDEVLSYAFRFVRTLDVQWAKGTYEEKSSLQQLVFSKGVVFDGENFGTPETSLIFQIKKTHPEDESLLVTSPGVEPGLQA